MVAVLAAGAALLTMAGLAIAKSFTLNVAGNAAVTNMTAHTTKHESIVVDGKGFAVYWLTGDARTHPECTKANSCFSVWPPVTAASARSLTKAAAIKGKLTTWSRNGFVQAVLNGRPLYTFAPDTRRSDATGEGVVGFGGTWHVEVP
jgi:predicted lipoprotein with Yx(FWY)xxD motif